MSKINPNVIKGNKYDIERYEKSIKFRQKLYGIPPKPTNLVQKYVNRLHKDGFIVINKSDHISKTLKLAIKNKVLTDNYISFNPKLLDHSNIHQISEQFLQCKPMFSNIKYNYNILKDHFTYDFASLSYLRYLTTKNVNDKFTFKYIVGSHNQKFNRWDKKSKYHIDELKNHYDRFSKNVIDKNSILLFNPTGFFSFESDISMLSYDLIPHLPHFNKNYLIKVDSNIENNKEKKYLYDGMISI